MTCEDLGPYRRAGRPAAGVCKRGHVKPPGKCKECHRMMDRERYHKNAAPKKDYMAQWRQDFITATGVSYGCVNYRGLRKADVTRAVALKPKELPDEEFVRCLHEALFRPQAGPVVPRFHEGIQGVDPG